MTLRVLDEMSRLGETPVNRAERRRVPGSRKREPFADRVPRRSKRVGGRSSGSRIPANIRATGFELDDDTRAYVRQRLGVKLGKYAPSIERVTVRVSDVNGPRGGVDQRCRIKVVLSRLPSVVYEARAASLELAIDRALAGIERAVRRGVQRQRTKPSKASARRGP